MSLISRITDAFTAVANDIASLRRTTQYTLDNVAAVQASTTVWPVGTIIQVRDKGYRWIVRAAGFNLWAITTAGGVLLEALPDSQGFVNIEQFGAVPDGNRLNSTGTDNTPMIRRAFLTPHNIQIGYGTYAVMNTFQNLKENRIVRGCGAGIINSAPRGDRLYFNAPSCILAIGNVATRRRITRRKFRANASAPNDPEFRTVLENWGAGCVFKDFSIELYCDYTNETPGYMGANWDIGFFNGCRSDVGCDHVTILGYFRAASFYWDVTHSYGIPNLPDIYGVPVPIPSLFDDDGPEYGRASGADGCWMNRCEARGKLARVILGPDKSWIGAPSGYYDWVTQQTYNDTVGRSGSSDFRSRDCALRSEHHSLWRMADPIGYGGTLTYAQMMQEDDFAPGIQHIDSGITNDADVAGPAPSARGIILDDKRYVTREIFCTRLGQVKELFFGQRTWMESNGTPVQAFDTSGNDIYNDRVNPNTHYYGHLCTNEYTGRVTWENAIVSLFTPWVYDWNRGQHNFTKITDRQGRERSLKQGWKSLAPEESLVLPVNTLRPGGHISISGGGIGNETVLSAHSAMLLFDVANTPSLASGGQVGANVTLLTSTPNSGNVPANHLGVGAPGNGTLILYNGRADRTTYAWNIL